MMQDEEVEIKLSDDMPLNAATGSSGRGPDSPREHKPEGKLHAILGDLHGYSASQRQRRRQYLAAAFAAATILFLVVVALVITRSGQSSRDEAKDIVDDVWDQLPEDVRDMIDRSANPCDDFYQFSCGKWMKNADIPGDKSAISASFSKVQDQNELVLKAILQENLPFIGELYSTCMNTTVIDAVGAKPIKTVLDRVVAVKDKNELFRLAGGLSKMGSNFFTGLGVEADAKDATVYALYASQAGLSLPDPDYYLDAKQWKELVDPYKQYISTVFQLAGWSEADAVANQAIVITFEQSLAKIYVEKEKLMDPTVTYNPVKLTEAVKSYPVLMGEFLAGTQIQSIIANNTAATAAQKNFVSIATPSFFAAAEKLIAQTPLSALKTMISYHLIRDFGPSLSEPFLDASFEFFSRRIGGQKARSPRWKVCLRRVSANFPDLMGKYYFIKQFDIESEQMAKDLVKRVEVAMTSTLKDLEWLDKETKEAALAKMALIANLIGHSTRQEHFPFVLSMDSYWDNMQTLGLYGFNKSVKRIGTEVDRDEWFMSASSVNAYYNPSTNQIVFPAGILQAPFFKKGRHPAQNFGAIGVVIGHEITHGFDDQGRYYDGKGNLLDWWDDETDKAFRSRTQCLVEQYNKFPVVSAIDETTMLGNVNGNYTLGENMADNGGVKVAFAALETYLSDRTEADELREDAGGMSKDAVEMLFFMSFAQAFCSRSTDEGMIRRIATDPHSPERWRVNGALMNNKAFSRVFECPSDSAMNPVKKCEVW
ncbi:hypothetical protein Poli38472_008357 [Pythium oligandrum]|uniref:Endothelin-converting enzyme 1 n=1 Tax=Pythium oligandrum TaxID=41045 RepID=A0A8K1FJ55_PYTOL|nr:hypothetical protein Poli38472_008357 [Pythium oligandrum]|eukprot:TMW65715.1 hypothetical protein Poli38472_008357 [Pythium oligandrum]